MDEQLYLKEGVGARTRIDVAFIAGDVHDHTYRQAVTLPQGQEPTTRGLPEAMPAGPTPQTLTPRTR